MNATEPRSAHRPSPGRGLPEEVAAVARRVLGAITGVIDRSWPRPDSQVWQVHDADGVTWYVKRHRARDRHDAEVRALRAWLPALGPGRAPA
ncbi:hypothetical protein [Carbonactinospora thermoautotrophica]|uniref:hypothetical protein n=1 Tax=Carbonactinospora thermoautotrophica TaxID=1469144 RepID=UPI00226DDA05|nr:hypothetical protein [Carbonactinospora thermoautotrophica]